MRKIDVIEHYGTQSAVAKALHISEAAVSQWDEVIPEGTAYKIESLTKRVLRVNPALYAKTTGAHSRRAETGAG